MYIQINIIIICIRYLCDRTKNKINLMGFALSLCVCVYADCYLFWLQCNNTYTIEAVRFSDNSMLFSVLVYRSPSINSPLSYTSHQFANTLPFSVLPLFTLVFVFFYVWFLTSHTFHWYIHTKTHWDKVRERKRDSMCMYYLLLYLKHEMKANIQFEIYCDENFVNITHTKWSRHSLE